MKEVTGEHFEVEISFRLDILGLKLTLICVLTKCINILGIGLYLRVATRGCSGDSELVFSPVIFNPRGKLG